MEKLNIEKFSPTKAEITALAERCKGLTIKGIDDKAGYNLVHQARMELKTARVNIQKTGKEARAEALKYQKAVIKLENELVAIIEPTERELEEKQKEVDLKKEMIKRQDLLPERKEKLKEINCEMDDEFLLVMNDIEFDRFFNQKKEEYLYEQEQKQKAEQEKIETEKRKLEEDKRLEQARREAAEQARKEAEERAAREKTEYEEKVRREKEEAERKAKEAEERKAREEQERIANEKAEQERLEKQKKYQKFLKDNGYSEAIKDDFYIARQDTKITLYKKVGEIIIE